MSVACIVDALEEGKCGWVQSALWRQAISHILYSDVRVSDDLALAVEILRCGVIGRLGVGEGAGSETAGLNVNVESSQRRDDGARLRESNQRGDHVGLRRDLAHDYDCK